MSGVGTSYVSFLWWQIQFASFCAGHLFPFLHLCFFGCNGVAVDRSINLLTEDNKVILFKVVGLLTWIFSFTDKLNRWKRHELLL